MVGYEAKCQGEGEEGCRENGKRANVKWEIWKLRNKYEMENLETEKCNINGVIRVSHQHIFQLKQHYAFLYSIGLCIMIKFTKKC